MLRLPLLGSTKKSRTSERGKELSSKQQDYSSSLLLDEDEEEKQRQLLVSQGFEERVSVNQRSLVDKLLARYKGQFTVFREL